MGVAWTEKKTKKEKQMVIGKKTMVRRKGVKGG